MQLSNMTNINEYLFLKLSLNKKRNDSVINADVSWKLNDKVHKFNLGESYLPSTVIVNPFCRSLSVHTENRNYKMEQNSVLFIEENEKFIIINENINLSDILILFLGADSIKKYHSSLSATNDEFHSSCNASYSIAPLNRIIRNETYLNSASADFLNGFEEYRYDTLYEDQLEQQFISRIVDFNREGSKKINDLSFKKRATRIEIYRRILNSVEYMHDCFSRNISLDELARIANISKFHYVRVFKDIFKITPSSYLSNVKISKAKEYLKSAEMPLTEISFKLGYENLSHFSMKFKKTTGITPSHFQRNLKKSNII